MDGTCEAQQWHAMDEALSWRRTTADKTPVTKLLIGTLAVSSVAGWLSTENHMSLALGECFGVHA